MPTLQKNFTSKINAIVAKGWPKKVIHANIPQPIDFSRLQKIPQYYRIYISLEGESQVKIPSKNGIKIISLSAGDAIIVYPNCWVFGMRTAETTHFNNLGIRIFDDGYKLSEQNSESWPSLSTDLNYPLPKVSPHLLQINEVLKLLSSEDISSNEIQSAHLLCTLFFLISKSLEAKVDYTALSKKQANTLRLQELCYHIDHYYNQSLNRKELAQSFSLPESTVAKYFKNELHTTFRQYLSNQRMKEAVKMLVKTDLTIGAISKITGYSHLESFTLAFENNFNCAPSMFRKSYRSKNNSKSITTQLENYSLLPLLSIKELQKQEKLTGTQQKITVPFTNRGEKPVTVHEISNNGSHKIRGKAMPNELIFLKTYTNATILIKNGEGETLGGYKVTPNNSGILFGIN